MEKGTFISSVSPYPEEEYYLGKSSWSATASDWDQRFEVGDVIADPSGSWTPGTAEAYIDQQVAQINSAVAGEIIARQNSDSSLQAQLNSEMNTRASQDANLNALINAGIREGGGVEFDIVPTQNSANGITSGGIYSTLRDSNIGFVDDTLIDGSNNLVKSGGIKKAIDSLGSSYLDAEFSLKPLYKDFYENSVILGSPYHNRLTLVASKLLLKGHRYTIIVKLENANNIQSAAIDCQIFSTNDLTDFNFVDENISGNFSSHKQELAFKGLKFNYTPSNDANYLGFFAESQLNGLLFSTFIYEENEKPVYHNKHVLGSPFYSNQELFIEYPFKKGNTYIIHINTEANITNGIYSLKSKDPFVIAEENLFFIGNSPTDLVYAFKPLKDSIGLGTWIGGDLYGKYVETTVYRKTPEDITYVIVDADICGDIDDLFAMRVLSHAEKQGKIVFVGINVSQPATESATGLDGFFCHEGISDMCIGLDSTASVASTSKFLNVCQKHYHTYTGNSDLEDSLDWYERALNFIPDNSKAILLTLGYYTSIVRLFNDTDLKSLFQRKINHVYCMGGNFVNSSYPEYNFQYNVENTRTFIGQCPVPIYFIGFETCGYVMGGKVLGDRGYTFDLMQMALRAFYNNQYDIDEPMERNAPDAVAAMIACVDDPEYYNLIYAKGNISVNNNGSVVFSPNAAGYNKWYAVWVNNTEDYPYELWKETMEMKLSHIMARDNEGLYSNVMRLPRA